MIIFKTVLTFLIVFLHLDNLIFTGTTWVLSDGGVITGNQLSYMDRYLFNDNSQFMVHCFSFISSYFAYKLLMQPSFGGMFRRIKPDVLLTLPMIPIAWSITGSPFSFVEFNSVYWFFWQWVLFLLTLTVISSCCRPKSIAVVLVVIVTLLAGSSGVFAYIYGSKGLFALGFAKVNAQYLSLGLIFSYINQGALGLTTTKSSFYEKWVLRFVFYYHLPVIIWLMY